MRSTTHLVEVPGRLVALLHLKNGLVVPPPLDYLLHGLDQQLPDALREDEKDRPRGHWSERVCPQALRGNCKESESGKGGSVLYPHLSPRLWPDG